jgi:hypothetical protein
MASLQQYRQQQLLQVQNDPKHFLRTPSELVTHVDFPTFQSLMGNAVAFGLGPDVHAGQTLVIQTADGKTYAAKGVFNPLTNQITPLPEMSNAPLQTASRKRSPYNDFMREELARIKAQQPGIDHKQAFKLAASRWKSTRPSH